MAEIGNLSVKIDLDYSTLSHKLKIVQNDFKAAAINLGDFGKTTEGMKLKSDTLTKQLEIQRQQVQALENSIARIVEVKGADTKATQLMEVKLSRVKAQMAGTEAELKKVTAELEKQTSRWGSISASLEKTGNKLSDIGKQTSDVGRKLSMSLTAPLAGLGALSFKAATDFESAFTGVIKTVDATDEQMEELKQGFRDMAKEIPLAVTELYGIGEAAGQLGIKTENILDFTDVMSKLGVTTNLSATEAASSLAQFANITQMSQGDFSKLGSTIVKLGNSLATTESDIVSMGTRLAGAGSQVGLTEAQIMGLAGALASVGIEAEAGGSAFSRVMADMQLAVETNSNRLGDFARVAGMSGMEFQKAFKTDAAGAIISFVKGLAAAEEQGTSAIKVLDDMGITEIRLRDSLLRAAGASGVFEDAIAMSNEAWQENLALNKEAALRFGTTESQLRLFKNTLQDLAATFGEVIVPILLGFMEKLTPLVQKFGELDSSTKAACLGFAGLVAAIGPLLLIAGQAVTGLGAIAAGVGKLSAALAAAGGVSGAFGSVLAVLTGPIGLTAAAIATLVASGVLLYKNWDEIKGKAAELGQSIAGTWEALRASVTGTWDGIKNAVVGAFQWMYDHNYYFQWLVDTISKAWEQVRHVTETVWNAVSGFLTNLWDRIKTQVDNAWNLIYGVIKGITDRIKELFNTLVDSAWNWGKNLLTNFIDGIKSMISRLGDTLSGIGETLAGYLGFHSPTKFGPGRFADEWAPNFMRMFAKGIEDNIPLLRKALAKAVEGMGTIRLEGDLAARTVPLTPAALQPAIMNYSTSNRNTAYGSTIFQPGSIVIQGAGDAQEVLTLLERKLHMYGVRF